MYHGIIILALSNPLKITIQGSITAVDEVQRNKLHLTHFIPHHLSSVSSVVESTTMTPPQNYLRRTAVRYNYVRQFITPFSPPNRYIPVVHSVRRLLERSHITPIHGC